jgi:predicted GNAT superfamily acetyltransferase
MPPIAMNESPADEAAILELNRAHVAETSALEAADLRALFAQAFHVGACDRGRAAFLIALDQDAIYSSPNFQWFKSRHERFVYIDRVIVAPSQRGRGLARLLYEDLFAAAARARHVLIGCEVNVEPPNPASDALHAALGFSEVGRAILPGGAKRVRYLTRKISRAEPRAPDQRWPE